MNKSILLILVEIMNIGIDYDYKRGNLLAAADKCRARNRILDQLHSAH